MATENRQQPTEVKKIIMNDFSLKLDTRTASGKKVAGLRREGQVPSIVYGGQDTPVPTQSPIVETTKVVHAAGKHSPVTISIDGKKHLAIIKTIDTDPVKRSIIHLAFHTINKDDIITTEVPIVLVGEGESAAKKAGLIILQAIEKIEIKGKPAALPESIELSIIHLAEAEQRLTVADLILPAGIEFDDADQDMDLVIASVYEPAALEAANEAAAGDATIDTEVEAENGTDGDTTVAADAAKSPDSDSSK